MNTLLMFIRDDGQIKDLGPNTEYEQMEVERLKKLGYYLGQTEPFIQSEGFPNSPTVVIDRLTLPIDSQYSRVFWLGRA